MKKLLLASLLLLTASVFAEEYVISPYFAIDALCHNVEYKKPQEVDRLTFRTGTLNATLGLKLHDNLGIESSFHQSLSGKYRLENVKFKNKGYSFKVTLFLPLNDNVKAFAGAGLGNVRYLLKATDAKLMLSRTIPVATGGFLVRATDNVGVRFVLDWHGTHRLNHETIKTSHTFNYGLGLQYSL